MHASTCTHAGVDTNTHIIHTHTHTNTRQYPSPAFSGDQMTKMLSILSVNYMLITILQGFIKKFSVIKSSSSFFSFSFFFKMGLLLKRSQVCKSQALYFNHFQY